MHDADVSPRRWRGRSSSSTAASLSTRESAAIGRYLVDRERETARLRRTVGVPWRGVAGPCRSGAALGRVVAGL